MAQAKTRDLYDVLDTSFGARDEPLFVTISTQSNDPEHILSKLIDDGLSKTDPAIVCHLYAADEDCALDDESQWIKANPALGIFRDREDLATAVYKAMRMPAEEPKVRNLFLNQRVSPSAPLIARAEWFACAGDNVAFDAGEDVYLGLDLSSVLDLTALVMGSVDEPMRVQSFFWKPAELLREHSDRDFGAGNQRYVEWRDAGHLLTSPGQSIAPEVIARFVAELTVRYRIRGLAYDRWRMDELMREFDRLGLQTVQGWRQGRRAARGAMGPRLQGHGAMRSTRSSWPSPAGHSFTRNNPLLNWNIGNAIATTDPAGNRKLDKSKARFRIDGAVALAMLLGLRARDRQVKTIDIAALIG